MTEKPSQSSTAFPKLEVDLGRQVREAQIDHEVFQRPLKICELTKCRATCCHDGVFLSGEEEQVITRLVSDREGTTGSLWLGQGLVLLNDEKEEPRRPPWKPKEKSWPILFPRTFQTRVVPFWIPSIVVFCNVLRWMRVFIHGGGSRFPAGCTPC